MPPTQSIAPSEQLERFRKAVKALGGQRPAATKINVGERHMRALCSGERPLHDGILRDIAAQLILHADLCKELERQISPAFASNLTAEQSENFGKKDGRRSNG